MAEVATATASLSPPSASVDTEIIAAPVAESTAEALSANATRSPTPNEPASAEGGSTEATPIVVDGEGTPAPPPAAEEKAPSPTPEELEAQALKKRKLAVVADESKKRGRRMFGLLQSTLKQAKSAGENVSGAARKRIELEERLASKLKGEREEMERKGKSERESKELKLQVVRKEEEIGRIEAIYSVRHATKLHLANYLCTTFALPAPPPSADGINVPFAPRLPHALRVNPSTARPIYYKPYRLLASQEDQIEDQVAAVKKAIRKEKEEWDDAKGEKIDGLEQAKRKRDEQLEEVERGEREVRQKRRREAEEKEEREKAQKGGDVQMVERSVDDVVREADKDDVAMASVPVVADEEEAAANEVDAGKAAIVVDEKMDGGDEDLEY